ncbi:MAG: hypothetical protein DRQ62_04345 [Gammaproteobacteria bacterium]|nr:MAG: hypothetical protein DRQ62_04345 [Gammaproteobacteria bacterium]
MSCCLFYGLGVVSADPVKWADNGHYYEIINDVPSMSWEEARDWAFELNYTNDAGQLYNGHLATITSAQENDFIESLPLNHSNDVAYFLGGYQTPTTNEATLADRKADWHWVTDEEWTYTSWRYNAPNNGVPNNFLILPDTQSEEYLIYIPARDPPAYLPFASKDPGGWDDARTDTFTDEDSAYSYGISWLIVEYEPANAPDPGVENPIELLLVSTEGKDVTADWSLMPEAQGYTLYYALADYKGDIDMETLDSINMGQAQSIFVANLPSGVTFYLAIMAHTSEGDVLSNIVKFMPFGGSVTYPETGELLMQIDDPDGIGSFSMMGTRNTDGSDNFITKITGDDEAGEFTLHITDNKPVSYETEDSILKFIYQGDAIVDYEIIETSALVRTQTSIVPRASGIACDQFNSADEYLLSVAVQIEEQSIGKYENIKELREMLIEPLSYIEALLYRKAINSSDFHRYILTSPYESHIEFLMNHPAFHKYQAIVNMKHLVTLSIPSLKKETEKIRQRYLGNYNEQCIDTPAAPPLPVTPTEIAMAEIDFDYECPTVEGGIYKELVGSKDRLTQYYVMNESDSQYSAVGLKQIWLKSTDGSYYLAGQTCAKINARPLGWQLYYYENGQIHSASYYPNNNIDVVLSFLFYPDGLLNIYSEIINDKAILYRFYLTDGTLSNECTGAECL